MKPFMRIVLDSQNPGSQATVVGYDTAGNLMAQADDGRRIVVDKFHVVETPEELEQSFSWYSSLALGPEEKCPRCGKLFNPHRGALSRRVNVSICSECGVQEALEDFVQAEKMGLDDWYIVKVWKGTSF